MPEINGHPGIHSKIASFFSAYQARLDQAAEYASPHHFERVARKVETTTVSTGVVIIIIVCVTCGIYLCVAAGIAIVYFVTKKPPQPEPVTQSPTPAVQVIALGGGQPAAPQQAGGPQIVVARV